MKVSFTSTSIGPLLTVKKPLVSHLTPSYLTSLPPELRWKCLYKRLYKLRFFIEPNSQVSYCLLLRNRFQHNSFKLRRELFLGSAIPLSDFDWVERMANTYAFVFNATCNRYDNPPPVHFYEEWKQAAEPKMEYSILRTILRMNYEMRKQFLGHDYQWVPEIQSFFQKFDQLAQKQKLQKEINQMHNQGRSHLLGFFQYEKTLMSLNESLKLCL